MSVIEGILQRDLERVETLLYEQAQSSAALTGALGLYVTGSGGKRTRSQVVLLVAGALGYDGPEHITVSAFLELIHSASLMHDDVVDGATRRRGRPSANKVFGNAASVRVGNFFCTRAFRMMTQLSDPRVPEIMTAAANIMTEGEILQLSVVADAGLTEDTYFQIIYSKTGRLFEVATQCAAIVASATPEQEAALAAYGRHLGTAFQLADDALDYTGKDALTGKRAGQDWVEGKVTLPLIHAMAHATPAGQTRIRKGLQTVDRTSVFDEVLQVLGEAGSLAFTRFRAAEEAQLAAQTLAVLPASAFRDALEQIAQDAAERTA